MSRVQWCCRTRIIHVGVLVLIGLVPAANGSAVNPEFAFIPASDVQTSGPEYDYRVSVFEIRNDEFVAFLNDAMANLANERGAYMYFDLDSENVYIHSAVTGVTGLNGSGTLLFDASANPYIVFSQGAYRVSDPAYADHPATGMSWFGAVKFCNWLTLEQGLSAAERAYTEAPSTNLAGWHPVTITTANWSNRGLSVTERDELLEKLGYRLTMGGTGAGPYNEWNKAASARSDTGGAVVFDALYGFGRSAIGAADANYLNSGDPFETGTSPVGFYDGFNLLSDGVTPTTDTDNAYGLYDLSGNVWEWMQDQGSSPDQRRNRGGSFRSFKTSLTVATAPNLTATSTSDSTGFRLAQSVPGVLQVFPTTDFVRSGPWGGPYDQSGGNAVVYTVRNFGGQPEPFLAWSDAPWILITPDVSVIETDETIEVTVMIDPICQDGLIVGLNTAEVTFEDDSGSAVALRSVRLTVREPLTITPSTNFTTTMAYGRTPSPPNHIYLVESDSDQTVSWSADWEETSSTPSGVAWLTVDPQGDVPPLGVDALAVAIDSGQAGSLPPGVYAAAVEITDDCTGRLFSRLVTLTVKAPFEVTPVDEVTSTGVAGNAFNPPFHDFTIENLLATPVTWTVEICEEEPGEVTCTPPTVPAWLELDVGGGILSGNASASVRASITATAASLAPGTYSYTLLLEEPGTGFSVQRVVTLEVTGLLVSPIDAVEFSGPLAGPFSPASFVYELQNSEPVEMSWEASVESDPASGLDWLAIDPAFGVILEAGGIDTAVVTLTADALLLPEGVYDGTVTFTALGSEAVRTVRLIVGGEAFALPMVLVPGTDAQTSGPQYDFRIGKFEVTNAEYARFLNDALRNRSQLRGQYLYHDVDSGDVYINDAAASVVGTGAPTTAVTTLLYDASDGRIGNDADLQEPYFVESGFESHPVVGVSWYGAAKFCNWMTLLQGLPADQRAYTEGPTAVDWGPVATDPASLIALSGYRLPMDDGEATAAPYNEWYKGATRKGTDVNGDPIFGALYGFGRDVLTTVDANYLDNGDTQFNGTTPVGFFDGIHLLYSGLIARDTANGYGLYDLCGNAAEWVHDLNGSTGARRGGHFGLNAGQPALRTDYRTTLSADSTFGFLGFRILQCVTPVELTVGQEVDQVRVEGTVGGPYSFDDPDQDSLTLTLRNDGAYTLDDVVYSLSSAGGWLVFDGVPPRQIPADTTAELRLTIGEAIDSVLVSPAPPQGMRLVSGRELQSDVEGIGPTYDFWIAPTEVTNAQFAGFLNDGLLEALDETSGPRSAYLYFDLTSGNVYANSNQEPEAGTSAPTVTLPSRLIYDATLGRVGLNGEYYEVETGFADHPVVGVSWYGAIKYCNWLTVSHGLPSDMRAYQEGADPADWHPTTIDSANWALRDLNDAERRALIRTTLGYRLPMDNGGGNGDASVDSADDYNEWYKAATRRIGSDGLAAFDSIYGFGRDLLTGADANFQGSGDTEEEGTTPDGFFDGARLLYDDVTETNETENGYGLYDLTGNVAEWVQDFFTSGNGATRATRGGNWNDPVPGDAGSFSSLRNEYRVEQAPEAVDPQTGFRVVRGSGHLGSVTIQDRISGNSYTKYVILDLREPFELTPLDDRWISGPFCADFEGAFAEPFTLTNHSASDMPWSVQVNQSWVTLSEPVEEVLFGTLPGGEDATLDIFVAVNETANDLPPGDQVATITFKDEFTDQTFTRKLTLSVEQPIEVQPDGPAVSFEEFWGDDFEALPAQTLTLSRCPACDGTCIMDYEVSADAGWLTLGPAEILTGAVPPPGESIDVKVGIDASAATLAPGTYTAAVTFALSDATHGALSGALTRTVELVVKPPIEILQPDEETWNLNCEIDTENLPSKSITLVNRHEADEIEVSVQVDVGWIDVDPPALTILPGQSTSVTLTLTDQAIPIPGDYEVEITVLDAATGTDQTRTLLLEVGGEFCVRPFSHVEVSAAVGGVPIAGRKPYRLSNLSATEPRSWSVTANPRADWVLINGVTADLAGGVINPGASVGAVVSLDATALAAQYDPAGSVEQVLSTSLEFLATGDDDPLIRNVSVTLVQPSSHIETSQVPRATSEPGGPEYSFVMGRFETSNDGFALFLNDAKARPDHPRGAYLYFDTDSGDVYVNTSELGGFGAGPGTLTKLVYNAAVGRIQLASGAYVPEAGFENHPVVGVSWYGALKYCNWLTLDQGIGKNQRCYTESTAADLYGWHPVTTTTAQWTTCDLNDAQRAALLGYRGYRLPMDDGYNNGSPPINDATADAPDAYNEWYKAAAFNGGDGHWTYGFGRNELNVVDGVDANYYGAGLPFADTTPVGFFGIDGNRLWDDPTYGWGVSNPSTVLVQAADNFFGLHDMTGNAYEWMQGRYGACGDAVNRRTIRGGKWAAADPRTLLATYRNYSVPEATTSTIGFRVMRTIPEPGDFDADGDLDAGDFLGAAGCFGGPDQPLASNCEPFDADGDGDGDLYDMSVFLQGFGGGR